MLLSAIKATTSKIKILAVSDILNTISENGFDWTDFHQKPVMIYLPDDRGLQGCASYGREDGKLGMFRLQLVTGNCESVLRISKDGVTIKSKAYYCDVISSSSELTEMVCNSQKAVVESLLSDVAAELIISGMVDIVKNN
ncbi:hypothetical protein [Photobacterium kishitanii]|uniref:Uncharacterized protein n=1 Tax=Photobacterium kishitanii TaxID=318456 RepID=A0A2T3KL05_9GAMM|nr:hypothetical protein [Photobacterium kishitanii]PSV00339.1 hypothetical protein C9J27_04225 [Photobacterium kishitanii]